MQCTYCLKEFNSLGIMRHRAMHYDDKQRTKRLKVVRVCADKDCPRCGFPEIILVCDQDTMEVLRQMCSSRKCHWHRKVC